jgi:hypothetical protein
VVFFPTEYEWEGATRAEDEYTHRVACLVVERYADAAGDAPKLWTAERVDFVHDQIVKALRFTRGGPAELEPEAPDPRRAVEVCDVEKLMTGGKLFYSLVELEFVELVTP